MGKYQQRGSGSSLFSSKWFVVASCGAIAMVLGAMSVGARSNPHHDPVSGYPTPVAANQTIIVSEGPESSPAFVVTSRRAIQKHLTYNQTVPLVTKPSKGQTATLTVNSLPGVGLSLSLNQLQTTISEPTTQALNSVLETTPPPTQASPTTDAADTSLQGTTPTTDTPPESTAAAEGAHAPETPVE